MGYSDRVDDADEKGSCIWLKANGAEIVDIEFPKAENYEAASYEVMLYEFKDGLNKYFAGLGDDAPVKNLHRAY